MMGSIGIWDGEQRLEKKKDMFGLVVHSDQSKHVQ
jgi:hypothetical protein